MSSDSETDEDYVPGEPEKVSEEESANEETDQQYQNELELKSKKRKNVEQTKGKKRRKTANSDAEKSVEEIEEEPIVKPEAEKKREDDLWAMFLDGTDTKPKPKEIKPVTKNNKPVANKEEPPEKEVKEDDNARERRIFEFAGETIVVENDMIKEKIKTADCPATSSKPEGPSRRPGAGGGVSGILGQLNKKNKLSTLEKSKLDWVTFKKEEGIEEEIQSHNKGKKGFLDRRDFLERADARQYEIERDLRMTRRSNR